MITINVITIQLGLYLQICKILLRISKKQVEKSYFFNSIKEDFYTVKNKMVKMIDNYTLVQVIGQGNYGKVYRGKNIKTNQEYAIKIIPADKLHQNSKLQQCTMNQVQTLTTIGQTDHIIMYYEMLKTKNNYYFVYEFCNGGTLMELLAKEHHLEENRALDIFKQLLQAFKVLNRQNIMHRDLKPENIFFSDNKVKLGDFGFCKGLRPQENLTKTMLGSPIYMAPQVLKGQAYSTKADIWSLGVILYEMLYGVCPFQSSSIAMLINTINTHDIALPANMKVTQKTQQLLKKLLTKDYFRRIGWIQLFNWFGQQDLSEQKQNIFKSASNINQSTIQKKNSLIQEWVNKNKLSELNVKQRSVSQDISKKQRVKFDLGSLGNISPTNFQQRSTPTNYQENMIPSTPKLGEDNKNIDNNSESQKDYFMEHKSYSAIREPANNVSAFQGYRKPASLPKKDNIMTAQQGTYGQSSNFKPQSSKKIFYSQNYQSVFTTPITQKSLKLNEKSIDTMNEKSMDVADRDISDLHESTASNNYVQNQGKNRIGQRLSMTKNSLINSRGNGSIIGSRSIKQQKSQSSKMKRRQMLHVHESCLNVLKQTFKKLEQRRQNYLRTAYVVMTIVLERLKQITKEINIVEIDLLDVSSLINYEIIQVDKMIIEIKQQLDSILQQIPNGIDDIHESLESEDEKIVRDFLYNKISHRQQQQHQFSEVKTATFIQNSSIIDMLPKPKQQNNQKYEAISGFNQQPTMSNNLKSNKAHYYTTNQFSQYYKNLVQSKEKSSISKISMIS